MPEVWIVYGMVYFPESEGFLNDPKMVGVASLGPAKGLAVDIKTFTKSKAVVVLHAQAESAAVSALVDRLRAEGLDPQSKSVPSAADLPAAFDTVKDSFKTVDPPPGRHHLEPRLHALSRSPSASRAGSCPCPSPSPSWPAGALLAAYYPSEAVGNQAARLAADLAKTGNPPSEKLVTPAESATALNKSTAQALKINVPKTFRRGGHL